ncbi:MAG: peptidoglycan DD-metalloendopeptidase family protein [Alphaproteobacteria bacterium]|nr:peptidoglycan DD-metalloendopeptidase family protein [Alphaproteobacteria bacterium]
MIMAFSKDSLLNKYNRTMLSVFRHALAVTAMIAALGAAPGHADNRLTPQENAPDPLEKLDRIEKQMNDDKDRVDSLTTSKAQLIDEQKRLAQELVRVAASAQQHERDLAQVEQHLAALETQEARASHELAGKRGKLASMLAVLQRIGREPPPALIVRPDDAAVAARSAIMLSAVVPAVQDEARRLTGDLTKLHKLRQQVAAQRMVLVASANALDRDRRKIETLITQKRDLAARTDQALIDTNQRLAALAGQAHDLRGLIKSLDEDARRPGATGGRVVVDSIASVGAAKIASLDGLRGLLGLPANGELVAGFGADDGLGGHLAGILLGTRPGAQVTSPCDGKILFAGPFRGYGQMLIIGVSGGYHVLLSGLANVDGVVGQEVLAGEPVGRMGSNPTQSTGSAPAPRGGRLYMEFRRNGAPIDPAPWFAALRDKTNG